MPSGQKEATRAGEVRAAGAPISHEPPLLLTAGECAEILRVSQATVYELARQNRLPGVVKIGRLWRCSKPVLLDWLHGEIARQGEAWR